MTTTTETTTAPPPGLPAVSSPAIKPGYLTTEFYLAWAAKILGILMVSGLLGTGSQAERICGAAIALLAELGYTYSRTIVKTAGAILIVGLIGGGAGAQISCAQTQADLQTAGRAVLDCTRLEAPQLEVAAVQLLVDVVAYYTKSGTPDWGALADAALSDAGDVKVCAIAQYEAARAQAVQPTPAGARPVAASPDALDLAVAKLLSTRGVRSIVTTSGTIN